MTLFHLAPSKPLMKRCVKPSRKHPWKAGFSRLIVIKKLDKQANSDRIVSKLI